MDWLHRALLIWLSSAVPASRMSGLRFSSELRLVIPRHCNKYTKRAFAVASKLTWNELHLNVHELQSLAIISALVKTPLLEVADP